MSKRNNEGPPLLLTAIPILDEILGAHSTELGSDMAGYRNHTYRVVNFCAAFSARATESLDKLAIAAAFHDIGIWTDGTFDYLQPSIRAATAYLRCSGRVTWVEEINRMILEHHKISHFRETPTWLVEPFRRADWVDVSMGLVTFGLARAQIREIFSMWPSAGFHKRLVQLSLRRLRTNPWSPLPMMRL